MLKKIKKWWQSLRYYVIADPADNSVTLSKALFYHIKNNALDNDKAHVFVFKVTHDGSYGFMANPCIGQPTQMCDIQYNGKYRCVGFETLCPSVGQILYDYGLDAAQRVKLSVSVRFAGQEKKVYYQIEKPNAKHISKHKEA